MPTKLYTGLRMSFGAGTLRWPRSAVTAPGDTADTSKGFLFICHANKNWNGFRPLWLKTVSSPAPKIKPLTALFFLQRGLGRGVEKRAGFASQMAGPDS